MTLEVAPGQSIEFEGAPAYLFVARDVPEQKKMQARQKQMSDDWQKLVSDKKMTEAQKQAKAQQLQASYQADSDGSSVQTATASSPAQSNSKTLTPGGLTSWNSPLRASTR